MNTHDRDLIAKVDQLLHRQGELVPLELLLSEGRLLYADYDCWRSGKTEYLDEQLFGDSDSTHQLLRAAADYAGALGLVAETLDYRSWGGGNPLLFSRDPQLNGLFRTAYRKDRAIPQLDLFMDNVGNNLVNAAIAALAERDHRQARKMVDELLQSDPGHQRIDPLLGLIEAMEEDRFPVDERQLLQLEREIAPLARDMLGRRATDYLSPLWRRAARFCGNIAFDPTTPDRHSSHYWLQAADWTRAVESIESTPDWHADAELLLRHGRACAKLQQQLPALLDLFRVSWRYPDRIDNCIERLDGLYRHLWHRFLDTETGLDDSDFPAWILIRLPGQSLTLDETQLAAMQPPCGFLTLLRLVASERNKLATDLRSALQRERPEFLKCYLAFKT